MILALLHLWRFTGLEPFLAGIDTVWRGSVAEDVFSTKVFVRRPWLESLEALLAGLHHAVVVQLPREVKMAVGFDDGGDHVVAASRVVSFDTVVRTCSSFVTCVEPRLIEISHVDLGEPMMDRNNAKERMRIWPFG